MNRYIPKGSYRKAKSTNGDEFIEVLSKKPYKGFYIEDLKGNFYGGSTPQENGPELQKIDIPKSPEKQAPMGGFFVNKVTQSERESGVLKRYFIQDKNNNKITEVDKQTHLQAQNNLVNTNFAQADWIVEGPAEDKIFNGFPFEGAESKNKKTINALESKIPGISTFVTDYKYLVVDPILAQKPVITSQTITQKDNKTQLGDDRKASFDYKSDSIYPGPDVLGSEVSTPVYKVTTDDLVLSLDAANTASYTQGSAYWYDLSGNSNTAEFAGSAYYQPLPTPSMRFNGTSDYMIIADSNTLSPQSGDFSVETWFIAQGDGTLYDKSGEYLLTLSGSALLYRMFPQSAQEGNIPIQLDVWTNATTTTTHNSPFKTLNTEGTSYVTEGTTTIQFYTPDGLIHSHSIESANWNYTIDTQTYTVLEVSGSAHYPNNTDISSITLIKDNTEETFFIDPDLHPTAIKILSTTYDDIAGPTSIVFYPAFETSYLPTTTNYPVTANLYINGRLAHTEKTITQDTNPSVNTTSPLILAASSSTIPPTTDFFSGRIAITRAYSKALSQAEVTQNYLAIKNRFHQ